MGSVQKALFNKLMIISGLCVVFVVGLGMLGTLVDERQRNARSIRQELTNQHVKPQTIITPFIAASINSETCQPKKIKINKSKNNADNIECTSTQKLDNYFPLSTETKQLLTVTDSKYKRGMYGATSYQGNIDFVQSFNLQALVNTITTAEENEKKANSKVGRKTTTKVDVLLILPISDLRGLLEIPTVTINGQEFLAKYPEVDSINQLESLEVAIPNHLFIKNSSLDFDIKIKLSGMEKVATVPLGKNFGLSMQTDWQTPNFVGDALPTDRNITSAGFDAIWRNQHLAIKNGQNLEKCINADKGYCIDTMKSFDTEFAKPNDVYLQTERSLKYGLLLLAISFGSFFLFEVIKSLRIHPMQYLLVSMALLVFYVLLLSLAEQILFWQAYTIAASACAGLIGWYAYFILYSYMRALLFTVLLIAQYIGFFTILTIESLNLVIGAVLCFALIAAAMFITRNINWYEMK